MPSPWTSSLFQDRRASLRSAQSRGSLARYLLVVFLPLVLIPLIVFAFLAYRQAQRDITEQVSNQLISLATLKQIQVERWAAARVSDIGNLAQAPDILDATQAYVLGTENEMSRARPALAERFDDYLDRNPVYEALLLVRTDGVILHATDRQSALVGESLSDAPYFADARRAPLLPPPFYDPRFQSQGVVIIAAAPIVDPQAGALAVLLSLVRADQMRDLVAPSPGLGSGRAYLVTRDGYELGSPVNPQAEPPASHGIQRALGERQNGSAVYADPSGQQVFGVYRWLPPFEMALLVEQSAAEAYAPITRLAIILAVIAVLTVAISVTGVLVFTRRLSQPIQSLTESALHLAEGDLDVSVDIPPDVPREIGVLAETFNSMAAQLRDLYRDLEQRVDARTRQLATAAEVGRVVTSIVTTEELLSRTVELIQERFGYYHASVFLLDEAGEHAFLSESTGEIGTKLKARGYRLGVGSNSLIGWVTANKKARVVHEVGEDPIHFKNELLPDTRSEAAIPLRIGDRVIGALDVQSREPNAFTPADVQVLQILADQIAVGIENGRLFDRQSQVMRLEQAVSSLTNKIHRSRKLDAILENAATELGRALGARRVIVRLEPSPKDAVRTAPAAPEPPADGNGQHSNNGGP